MRYSSLARLLAGSSVCLICAAPAQTTFARETVLDAHCRPVLSSVERRLLDRATMGTDNLRLFLSSRVGIYDEPIYETAVWAERVERERARCLDAQQASTVPTADAAALGVAAQSR